MPVSWLPWHLEVYHMLVRHASNQPTNLLNHPEFSAAAVPIPDGRMETKKWQNTATKIICRGADLKSKIQQADNHGLRGSWYNLIWNKMVSAHAGMICSWICQNQAYSSVLCSQEMCFARGPRAVPRRPGSAGGSCCSWCIVHLLGRQGIAKATWQNRAASLIGEEWWGCVRCLLGNLIVFCLTCLS